MEGSQVFGNNQRFKNAIALINSLPDDKFPLVLGRIAKKLHLQVGSWRLFPYSRFIPSE